jgi:hypothetical protein
MDATGAVSAGAIIDEVKTAAREVRDGALDQVHELRDDMSERATGTVNEKKSALADSLGSIVNALRAAEKALRDDGQESLAAYSSNLATYVDRSTGYIRDNDMNGLMTDLQKVGRENSGMFMGGTFVAGAALGRFLRASAPEPAMGDAPSATTSGATSSGATSSGMTASGATPSGITPVETGASR